MHYSKEYPSCSTFRVITANFRVSEMLGFLRYFSNDCTWHHHIQYIIDKAWTRINIMRKLKFKLDRHSLEKIYLTFIRPLLEYGDVLWDNCTLYEKDELDKIQNKAARIATGATKLISLYALSNEVKNGKVLTKDAGNINWNQAFALRICRL